MNIGAARDKWIDTLAREGDTKRTYKRAVNFFIEANKLPPDFDTQDLTHKHYSNFLIWLQKDKNKGDATRTIYSIGVNRFLTHLHLNDLSDTIDLEKTRAIKTELTKHPTANLRQFSIDDIEKVLSAANTIIEQTFGNERQQLRAFRDRAFLLTLADTGMRVHEACKLRRGNMDWNEGRAVIVGKGRQQGVIRFTSRSLRAIRDYHDARMRLDGMSGKPLSSLPVFAQHSRKSGDKIKPISTNTGRNIIDDWVIRVLGEKKKGTITPHSFRHYFVTIVLRATGNLKKAQGLARHKNIQVTARYAHLNDAELDQTFHEVFEKR